MVDIVVPVGNGFVVGLLGFACADFVLLKAHALRALRRFGVYGGGILFHMMALGMLLVVVGGRR
ncbi:hypothetical protein, partial [Diaphorobacter sp.]|uniref:hypothetical protein n=1 Tax=Diaphorobacter sp. TaxID=1934310 RepID=UPI002582F883